MVDHEGMVLDRLADYDWKNLANTLGLSSVYLLGLWDFRGPIVVASEEGVDISLYEKRLPSVFAISDHTQIDPRIGTRTAFKVLVDKLHSLNLSVIVDFVPNHTGTAHSWVTAHPDYYKKSGSGMLTAFSGDVVELDYENPAVVDEMIGVLRTIVGFGVDGVRCDMAHLVPTHFWKQAITTIKQLAPRFRFIAEGYDNDLFQPINQHQLLNSGFDAVYDEGAYRNLKMMTSGSPLSYLLGHLNYVRDQPAHLVHYVSNHDDGFPLEAEALPVYQALFSTLHGTHLLFNGALWGRRQRIAHHYFETLSKAQTDPLTLLFENKTWFTWLSSHSPQFGPYMLMGETVIQTAFKTADLSGVCVFNVSNKDSFIDDPIKKERVKLAPYSVSLFK